ncbi:SAM-dependent methyltransferase [Desulfobaculum bizertense]|uniref:Methyltransferase domain-containing protein n=1 Tax=Desulfobaculum bizertense DSM 18034 TaxID=1121442 RepID=A0A1T4WHX4_9BACT|nr:class I SAM-dependent methyltransferase [Desulfobaculum bizertense]UIJ39393.1 class I SAM-dependent methyltransferase [Desulfobaculum bizertense]SKA76505.1 Methyltransferase domain-containing protein [Desulfobaculum bizertense DSM 18034]
MERTPLWDRRYSEEGFTFGTCPNAFLTRSVSHLTPGGHLLSLGEGEGRNAVWLAQQGFRVTAVDASRIGLDKAQSLARQRGVRITTIQANLADFPLPPSEYDGIISIFCHLPPKVRVPLYQRCAKTLRPSGIIILEAYTPDQLNRDTGGPQDAKRLMTAQILRDEFPSLRRILLQERIRSVYEGKLHTGKSSVVQFIGQR